ncbi:MAG: glycosyltransferase family 8 protein [Oscillospiraceae bacterium]|nr:glycosyltransferase family 8 protein [Oscillospiraceae bacterium]
MRKECFLLNILVTLDKGYLKPLCVMLHSLVQTNPDVHFDVYVMNRVFGKEEYGYLESRLCCKRLTFHDIKVEDGMLQDAPVTDRYPHEMYYRIFAAKFLPDSVDRILYLDPDLVVVKSLEKLYATDLGSSYFAAASHVGKPLRKINGIRLQMDCDGPYINSGVMLMNIALLRKEQDLGEVFRYIEKNKNLLFLPDQDVISAIYSSRIIAIDPYLYNMTERMLLSPKSIRRNIDFDWVQQNSAIIHYCGRNKPWKENYSGVLDCFYNRYSAEINQ